MKPVSTSSKQIKPSAPPAAAKSSKNERASAGQSTRRGSSGSFSSTSDSSETSDTQAHAKSSTPPTSEDSGGTSPTQVAPRDTILASKGKEMAALDLASHHVPKTDAALDAPKAAKNKFSPSGRELLALDLAVSKEALSVPAVMLPRFTNVHNFKELLRRAELVRHDQLVDEFGTVYQLGKKFSEGSFGVVRYAQKSDLVVDQQYVAKEIRIRPGEDGQRDERMLRAEVKAMILAKSALAPHAILKTKQSVFILMPVLDGDCFDLATAIEKLPDDLGLIARSAEEIKQRKDAGIAVPQGQITVAEIRERLTFKTITSGLQGVINLHRRGQAHRDIKPENFMYDRSGEIYLGDYGLASKDDSTAHLVGTDVYMPIEALLMDKVYDSKFSPIMGDMWSIGATAMMMLTGKNLNSVVLDEPHFALNKQSSQNSLYTMVQDYDAVWNRLGSTGPEGTEAVLREAVKQKNSAAPHLLELLEASPDLFMPIIAMMAPNPKGRPSAEAALQYVTDHYPAYFGDIAKLIKTISVPGRKAMQPEPQDALRKLVAVDAAMKRRETRSTLKSSLHMSFYETAAHINLSALLPKEFKTKG